MDPLAVYLAMQEAAEHMRAGKGPTLVEADVYRYFHQNGPFPGSAFGPGDDTLRARDGKADRVRCGPGHDVAVVDKRDRVSGCEVVRRG